jgi:N-acetylmuramoyl-L-alanine amidase
MCVFCTFSRRGLARMALGLAATSLAVPSSARANLTKPTIMLDPGHGGFDPGAVAPDGLQEKDVTLATALTVRDALHATGRYAIAMTRERDTHVTLTDRVAAAEDAGAALFLALHCDHLPVQTWRGASIFTLSSRASDNLAARLAGEENAVDGPSPPRAGLSPPIAAILANLETRATRLGSATLAADIQASFRGVIPLMPDPERSANFAVLRDPSTPSTLLEMGCLTNPLDEKLLRDEAHRRTLALRLTAAIDLYFSNNSAARIAG